MSSVQTRVTAKMILNPYELASWSRVFLADKGADFSRRLVDAAKEEAPVRSGRLRRNIKATPVRFTGPYRAEGGAEIDPAAVPYAPIVRWGSRPHVIRARRARALHFYWEKVGHEVFFKSVNHPGTKPNTFMEKALSKVARNIR